MAAIKGLHEARGDLAQDLSHSNSLQYEVVMTVESSRRCGLLALGNVSPQHNFRRNKSGLWHCCGFDVSLSAEDTAQDGCWQLAEVPSS